MRAASCRPSGGGGGGYGGGGGGGRTKNPLPDSGPWKAFVGNLPFDTVQGDLDAVMAAADIPSERIASVYLVRDRETDSFKGTAASSLLTISLAYFSALCHLTRVV